MQIVTRVVSVIALAWFAAPAFAQDAPPPVEAFGRLPMIQDVAISPDGTRIAIGQSQGARSIVRVVDLDQQRTVYGAEIGDDMRLRGVGWASDAHASFVISQTFHPGAVLPGNVRFRGSPRRVDYYRTGVVNIAERDINILTVNEDDAWQDQGSYLIAPIEGDPGYGRMIGRARGIESVHQTVYRVNLETGNVRVAAPRGVNEDTIGFILDQSGVAAVRIDSDRETNRWRVFVYDGELPRLLREGVSETGRPMQLEGLLPDGRLASLEEDPTGEFFRLVAIDRATGESETIFQQEKHEVNGALYDPWTRQVVGVSWTEEESAHRYFDEELQRAYEAVRAEFDSGAAWLTSWSRDRSRFVVYAEQGLDGGGYYVYQPSTDRLSRVGMAYPELAEEPRGQRQSINYRARDGVRVPAYLTLPAVDDPRNLPLVLLVHGGPHARDTLDFDWWSAFLASRGYAVLQPNFRGSSGYGRSWEHAGRGQWGGLMQTDVEDGVAALTRSGIADAERVCIVGASYGGYAALAGAALTPDRYKCAVSVAGVSDLIEMLRQVEAGAGDNSMGADFWRLSIGDRREDRDRIRDVSPANLADRVTAPVLLMHGTDDTVVPILQSRRMLDRLRSAGKDVRFVELRGDDHWLSDEATRIQMLREVETFLAAHIGEGAN